ncbi:SGNH/GDSL hydrolase family protein [Cecembia sp.]|uniref:SGNH/GDSL hydrolase family protein n=1 Tax=Cecembia sp. TaxID=1898110 RepID=UPI0025BFEC17|nr:SGNH/GDSL hydrolase family protein [Cecembia sp.]
MIVNRLLYFFELLLLVPVFPLLYYQGKKLRHKISRLPSHAEYLAFQSKNSRSNILIIGESTAAGVGASSEETTFASQIYRQLGSEFSVYNLGKNGIRAERLKRLLVHGKQEISTKIQIAIILIGANDCFKFTPPSKFQKELREFLHLLTNTYGMEMEKVIIPTVPPVHQFPALPWIIRFFLGWHRKMLIREIQHLEKKVPQFKYKPMETKLDASFFAEDGIHPSDLGYESMARRVLQEISR